MIDDDRDHRNDIQFPAPGAELPNWEEVQARENPQAFTTGDPDLDKLAAGGYLEVVSGRVAGAGAGRPSKRCVAVAWTITLSSPTHARLQPIACASQPNRIVAQNDHTAG